MIYYPSIREALDPGYYEKLKRFSFLKNWVTSFEEGEFNQFLENEEQKIIKEAIVLIRRNVIL